MKKHVRAENTALTDAQQGLLGKIDFADTYATTNHVDGMEEITRSVFDQTPRWVDQLFAVRNRIAGLLGLETTVPDDRDERFAVGGYVRTFEILAMSDREITLGADESHLNFRALISDDQSDAYNIKVTTLVEYNNLLGRLYMTAIKPFHKQVVKRMVGNAFAEGAR